MATDSKTPKSTTPRKRTPKAAAATAAVAKPETKGRPASAKPAAKARPKRAPKAAAPAAKVEKRSTLRRTGIAAIAATGLGAIGAIALGVLRARRNAAAEPGTVPTDLMGQRHPDGSQRAIEQFRPDPTASVPAKEREAFAPALAGGSAPTLVAGQADELRRSDAAPS
ncbi:hypothetical protein [Sphingomonas sp. TDK1]|uniref:hypothetical protein n=1 Tax=Sphingomonas sp. TDK1 TaxID=453247 RepID=UPI0007D8E5A8|nr:hypothetical protein [Sphingomonas sp. TDK1]OAN66923.1 hypothetical protein A7X12_09905 [Sphingomonas sp. TDK1]